MSDETAHIVTVCSLVPMITVPTKHKGNIRTAEAKHIFPDIWQPLRHRNPKMLCVFFGKPSCQIDIVILRILQFLLQVVNGICGFSYNSFCTTAVGSILTIIAKNTVLTCAEFFYQFVIHR